jgi:hypothetical protein
MTFSLKILFLLLAGCLWAEELPGDGRRTQAVGSPELLAMNGRMMGVVAPRAITMIDLQDGSERCSISMGAEFSAAAGGQSVLTHRPDTGELQAWDARTGEEQFRHPLGIHDYVELAMGVNNGRYVAMLWRDGHTLAGVFDAETRRIHQLRETDFGAIVGVDPNCEHLILRRGRDQIYRVHLPRPLKDIKAEPLVSGVLEPWLLGNTLTVDGHLIDLQRKLLAKRPQIGYFVPSIVPGEYAWFDSENRQVHIRDFTGRPRVSVQVADSGQVALLTGDRVVMRQRNQQRIYPLSAAAQDARFLHPGELWAGRLTCGSEAEVEVINGPAGLTLDRQCHALVWTVPDDYQRQPIPIELHIREDGETRRDTQLISPLREDAIPAILSYLWLRLHYDVRAGDRAAVDQRIADLTPLLPRVDAVPIPLRHLAKTPLGDRIRRKLAPALIARDPLRANLLLAVAALRAKESNAGSYLLAALAARPILAEHDSAIRLAMAHFAEHRPPPPELAEFASALHANLTDVDRRLEERYHELRQWLWERR